MLSWAPNSRRPRRCAPMRGTCSEVRVGTARELDKNALQQVVLVRAVVDESASCATACIFSCGYAQQTRGKAGSKTNETDHKRRLSSPSGRASRHMALAGAQTGSRFEIFDSIRGLGQLKKCCRTSRSVKSWSTRKAVFIERKGKLVLSGRNLYDKDSCLNENRPNRIAA